MNNMLQWAQQMLQANHVKGNNNETQQMIDAIAKGDSQAGEALANRILQQSGVSKEQALQQAKNMFHIPM